MYKEDLNISLKDFFKHIEFYLNYLTVPNECYEYIVEEFDTDKKDIEIIKDFIAKYIDDKDKIDMNKKINNSKLIKISLEDFWKKSINWTVSFGFVDYCVRYTLDSIKDDSFQKRYLEYKKEFEKNKDRILESRIADSYIKWMINSSTFFYEIMKNQIDIENIYFLESKEDLCCNFGIYCDYFVLKSKDKKKTYIICFAFSD